MSFSTTGMKIVILSDSFPPTILGGADIIASNLASQLSDKGNNVYVITTTRNHDDAGVSKYNNLIVYRIHSDYHMRWRAYLSLNNRKVVKEVENILKNLKPDVVHAHNVHEYLSYASLKMAKKYSKVVLLTFHDFYSINYGKLGVIIDSSGNVVPDSTSPINLFLRYKFRYNPFRNIIIRKYLMSVDKMFAVSLALKSILESRGISPVDLLHNGIDVSKWGTNEKSLENFKQKYNLQTKKVLFFGGRLSGTKGGKVSVDVLAKVSAEMKDVVLLVAGTKNKSAEEMLARADKLGIKDKIIFTGWIDHNEISYAYASSDVVLVLSQYIDPFPTLNLEAMASKKPVVGTMFGGTPEIVVDDKTGYIVDPKDVTLISEKILDLLENPEKAEAFGLAGFERVKRSFDESRWAEATLASYATMLSNKVANKTAKKK